MGGSCKIFKEIWPTVFNSFILLTLLKEPKNSFGSFEEDHYDGKVDKSKENVIYT